MSYIPTDSDRLDAIFAALADPTRRGILARLARGEAAVQDLVKPFGMSQPAISRHLKVLEAAGLISGDRAAQKRPRRMETHALDEATEWIELLQKVWSKRFVRLDGLIEELKGSKEKKK
ncbi:MAG: metalloregulator ArsR/SmtB family transcription factor [Spirochaetia bacterium]|nr:metalloregulator ArsR/SmtB family transcription factor [Spirochaetia bacterium]